MNECLLNEIIDAGAVRKRRKKNEY
jgi:hypothetical protein